MSIDMKQPKSFGGLLPPEYYNKMNYSFWKAMNKVEAIAEEIGIDFGAHFGRPYSNVEAVNIGPKTRLILVTLSSITSTARGVIRDYPEIGLLKLRLFKPFPREAVRQALAPLSRDAIVAIVERNFLGDREGGIMQEMKRALYGSDYKMYDFFAGTGGKDVPPETIEKIIHRAFQQPEEATWIDVNQGE